MQVRRYCLGLILLAGSIAGLLFAQTGATEAEAPGAGEVVAATLAQLPPADVTRMAAVSLVPRANLLTADRCGEAWLYARPVILIAIPDALCPLWWLPSVVKHEVGHAVCWQTAGDSSEVCADAYARRFP